MEIHYSQLDNGIRLIKLSGRLDIYGTTKIEPHLNRYTNGDALLVILDIAEVDFIASIGIRMLVMTAKSVGNHRGKIVILNPPPDVKEALELTGILQLIPVYNHPEEATKYLLM